LQPNRGGESRIHLDAKLDDVQILSFGGRPREDRLVTHDFLYLAFP
jgi:hypothetical protein